MKKNKILRQQIIERVFHVLHLQIGRNDFVELDCSTELKFSRHIIVHLGRAVFKSSQQVGLFIKGMCRYIESHVNRGWHCCIFFECFCDVLIFSFSERLKYR